MSRLRTVMVGFGAASVAFLGTTLAGCVSDAPVGMDAGGDAPTQDSPAADTAAMDGSDADTGRCDRNKPFGAPVLVNELNGPYDDSAPHLSWDELTVYFGRRPASDTDPFKVYYARRGSPSDPFGMPVPLSAVNTIMDAGVNDLQPMVSQNDRALYFTSERLGTFDLFTATRMTGGSPATTPFGSITPLTNLNHPNASESRPFLSADANELWYTANLGNGQPFEIYRALGPTFATGALAPDLNTQGANSSPTLSADGLTMYFASDRTGGSGGNDIWFAKRASVSATFQAAVNLSTVNVAFNTLADETPGWVAPDDCTFWFASERSGNLDIYMATRPK